MPDSETYRGDGVSTVEDNPALSDSSARGRSMISFVTFFLLLVIGTHPVQVAVDPNVAWVELHLDGVLVGRVDGEPWTIACDFGDRLRPHELVATSFGNQGQQLHSVRQWINMPRPGAEVAVLLERDGMGHPVAAQVNWEALGDDLETKVTATLDGNPVAVEDPHRIVLSDMPRDRAHIFAVRVDFGNGVEASDEIAFGGSHGSEISSELTAVPVVMTDDTEVPPLEQLHGQFSVDGRPARVLGIERSQGQTVIVRDGGIDNPSAAWTDATRRRVVAGKGMFGALNPGDRIRFLSPYAPIPDRNDLRSVLFPLSPWFSQHDIPRLIARLRPPPTKGSIRTVAAAVAVAGLEAVRGNHPRAVVLLLGRSVEDHSTHTPREVRRFLADLNVPLFVWRIGQDEHPNWPEAVYVASYRKLTAAVERVRRTLESQRIVWIEGRHLPQSVRVTDAADAVRLVGGFQDLHPAGEQPRSESVAAGDPPTPLAGIPTFAGEIEVIVVNIEAYVRDRKGRPITDLELEEFQLVVDGVEKPISHFSLESRPRVDSPDIEVPSQSEQPQGSSSTRLVIFVDNDNLTPASRRRALDEAQRFAVENAHPSLEMMVIRRQLGLHVVQPFTNRGEEIVAALESMRADTGGLIAHKALRLRILRDLADCDRYQGQRAERCRDRVRGDAERAASEERLRVLQTIRDLAMAIESLGNLPGRKALVYVSDGLPLIAGLDLVLPVVEPADMSRLRSVLDCSREFGTLVETSLRSGVSLYAVDAAGLEISAGISAEGTVPVTPQDSFEMSSNFDAAILYIAQATGGHAVVNANNLAAELEHLRDDLLSYYSIGFTVPASRRDTPHKVEIKLPGHQDLEIRHRAMVYEKSADTRARQAVMAGLLTGESDNPIEMEVIPGDAIKSSKGVIRIPLRIVVPIANISLTPNEEEGNLRGKLLVFVASEGQDDRRSKIVHQEFAVVLPAGDLPQAIQQTIAIETSVLVASDDVGVSLAVADSASGVVSFRIIPVRPQPHDDK